MGRRRKRRKKPTNSHWRTDEKDMRRGKKRIERQKKTVDWLPSERHPPLFQFIFRKSRQSFEFHETCNYIQFLKNHQLSQILFSLSRNGKSWIIWFLRFRRFVIIYVFYFYVKKSFKIILIIIMIITIIFSLYCIIYITYISFCSKIILVS